MSSQTDEKQEILAVMPRQTMKGHTDHVNGVVHLPDGRRIITCSGDGSLRLWDLYGGAQIGEDWRDDEDKEAGTFKMALSPNGKSVVSGDYDGKVKLWDVETGKVVAKWTENTDSAVLCWSADGNRVGSGSKDGTARVWDVKTGKTILTIKTGHETVWVVIYSPDNTQIATGGHNENAAKIWDTKTGELIATLKHDRIVERLAWTSDGKKLISGSFGPIRIFDTATRQQIAILEGHTDYVNAISLSQNNRLLASTSYGDKTVWLWNLDTNLQVCPPLQHKDEVQCAAFSADGKVLATGCWDKNVYVWGIYDILKKAGLEHLLQPSSDAPGPKSLKNGGATKRPPIQARRIPAGFFNGVQNGIQSSATHGTYSRSPANHPRRALAPSSANVHALLERLSSFFHHSRSNADGGYELQQRPSRSIFSRGPPIVEVAAVQDRKPLAVAPRQVQDRSHTRPPGTTAPGATPAQSPPIPWWAHVVLFLCCTSARQATQSQQQQQSQAHVQVQAQASSSQAQPATAAASMPTTPAPATSTTPPNPATVQSLRLPLRARIVLFLCCASPAHADGH
ncbi:WD40 repeat-like protein [Suillus weaverae]|nr:WD40 repeat-like protein [Suillus weaverae]